jgi:hypothetical protein
MPQYLVAVYFPTTNRRSGRSAGVGAQECQTVRAAVEVREIFFKPAPAQN